MKEVGKHRIKRTQIIGTVLIITGLLFVFGVQLRYALMSLYGVPSAQITSIVFTWSSSATTPTVAKCVQGFDLYGAWRGATNGPYESFYRFGGQINGMDWHMDGPLGQISFAESSGQLIIVPCKSLIPGTYTANFYLQQISKNGTVLAEDRKNIDIKIVSSMEVTSKAWFYSKDWQIDATTASIYALIQTGDIDFQDWLYLRVFRNGVEIAHGDSGQFGPNEQQALYVPKYGQTVSSPFQSGDDLQLWSLATNTKLDSYIIIPRITTLTTPPIVAPLTLWDIMWQYRTQIGISFIIGGCLIIFAQIFSRRK